MKRIQNTIKPQKVNNNKKICHFIILWKTRKQLAHIMLVNALAIQKHITLKLNSGKKIGLF